MVPLSLYTTLSVSATVVDVAVVSPSSIFNSLDVAVTPSIMLSSAVDAVKPSRVFNSDVLAVKPSRILISVADAVTRVPANFKPPSTRSWDAILST